MKRDKRKELEEIIEAQQPVIIPDEYIPDPFRTKEVISIHLGNAGIMVGNSCWELFCLEHGIQPDGTMIDKNYNNKDAYASFFNEYKDGKY